MADVGAGTGAFAAAFSDWFSLSAEATSASAAISPADRPPLSLDEPVGTGTVGYPVSTPSRPPQLGHAGMNGPVLPPAEQVPQRTVWQSAQVHPIL